MEIFVAVAMFKKYMAILGVFSDQNKANDYLEQIVSLIRNEEYRDLISLIEPHLSEDSPYDSEYIVQDIIGDNYGPIHLLRFNVDASSELPHPKHQMPRSTISEN